jgi:hypothetical protein
MWHWLLLPRSGRLVGRLGSGQLSLLRLQPGHNSFFGLSLLARCIQFVMRLLLTRMERRELVCLLFDLRLECGGLPLKGLIGCLLLRDSSRCFLGPRSWTRGGCDGGGCHLPLLGLQPGDRRLFNLPLLLQCVDRVTRGVFVRPELGEFLLTLCNLRLKLDHLSLQRRGCR